MVPGAELGAMDDVELEKGRRMAIGPENRPGFNDIGNVGDCVQFPSGAMEEESRVDREPRTHAGNLEHAGRGGAGGESWL